MPSLWQGQDQEESILVYRGCKQIILVKIRAHIRVMMRFEDAPQFMVIHIGGNDIGNVRIGLL